MPVKWALLAALLGTVACQGGNLVAALGPEKPNIVLILADDLGYGDVGAYGTTLLKTPHVDRLASQGVQFTSFYSSANVCTPSRAGMLTGRYPIRSGLAHGTIESDDVRGLPDAEYTLAEMLRTQGYRSALIGKWHLGHQPQHWPTRHGFDLYYGIQQPNDVRQQPMYRNHAIVHKSIDPSRLTLDFAAEAVAFMEAHRHERFFLLLSLTAPHIPLLPSPDFTGSSSAGAYGDTVQEMDWAVGEIMGALKHLGLRENTLVMFTSDNGPFPEGSSGGLRGGKGTTWDGAYRVPFIARWPGHIPAGSRSSGIAMNIDLLPTLAHLAAAKLPEDVIIDGKNITGLLQGNQQSPHEVLYFFDNERIAALRTQHWRAVLAADYRGINRWLPGIDIQLLFDMERDPGERYSVMPHRPEVWQTMMMHLARGQRELQSLALQLEPIWGEDR